MKRKSRLPSRWISSGSDGLEWSLAIDEYAFGFLDPQHIIRGCHFIPDFSGGRTNNLLATTENTAARLPDTEDWTNYYVDIFVGRDMFMRYFGGGIGHMNITSQMDDNEDEDPTQEEEPDDGDCPTTTLSPSDSLAIPFYSSRVATLSLQSVRMGWYIPKDDRLHDEDSDEEDNESDLGEESDSEQQCGEEGEEKDPGDEEDVVPEEEDLGFDEF
ncbi:hypothetical protein C8R45DRAFT_1099186 [Mycena sanguinolenta]|nr:hypothetical protein C8R45DRAFT_1099186 [Mycena sanguinolenta]